MNLTFLLGIIGGFVLILYGMSIDSSLIDIKLGQILNFWDPSSVIITIGGTFAAVVASHSGKMLASMPKHFGIVFNQKKYNPMTVIDEIVEFAQIARKNGLLALEEKANQLTDAFFKKSIMLIVDGNDPDKVRDMLTSDIDQLTARHDATASMYDKASSAAPAFGMIGTLIGLINMLQGMDPGGGSSSIGKDMGVALITTLYGVLLANLVFNPIAGHLRIRDEEECLCRMLVLEGVMAIQGGENPKFIQEKLMGFLPQNTGGEGGGKKAKGKKAKE